VYTFTGRRSTISLGAGTDPIEENDVLDRAADCWWISSRTYASHSQYISKFVSFSGQEENRLEIIVRCTSKSASASITILDMLALVLVSSSGLLG
jgi:hypothetical protein